MIRPTSSFPSQCRALCRAVVGVAAAMLLVACSGETEAPVKTVSGPPVLVVPVLVSDVEDRITATGEGITRGQRVGHLSRDWRRGRRTPRRRGSERPAAAQRAAYSRERWYSKARKNV